MPTDTDDAQKTNPGVVDQTAVSSVPPASAPGAAPAATNPMPGAEEPKVDETIVPGATPAADVPAVSQLPTDLPKPVEEGTDTGNQGGVPPATTGM